MMKSQLHVEFKPKEEAEEQLSTTGTPTAQKRIPHASRLPLFWFCTYDQIAKEGGHESETDKGVKKEMHGIHIIHYAKGLKHQVREKVYISLFDTISNNSLLLYQIWKEKWRILS